MQHPAALTGIALASITVEKKKKMRENHQIMLPDGYKDIRSVACLERKRPGKPGAWTPRQGAKSHTYTLGKGHYCTGPLLSSQKCQFPLDACLSLDIGEIWSRTICFSYMRSCLTAHLHSY